MRGAVRWSLVVLAGFILALYLVPLPAENRDFSAVHIDSAGRLLRLTLSPRDKYRVNLSLSDMSPALLRGFLAYEDRHFYHHPGINPFAILRALVVDIRHRDARLGASTITMQLARLMSPRARTFGAKLMECFRALQLEARYSKDEILRRYLNSVPMGGNLEGVGAAAYLYFGKPARALSAAECALLISLPRSPNRFRPDLHPERARVQRAKVMDRIAPELGEANATAPIPAKRIPNPFLSPHLVIRNGRDRSASYSMDPALQDFVADALRRTVSRFHPQGVFNGAVMVLDNRTMKVVAYVGSPDFTDSLHGGQINGAAIPRSPGSLLKPFIYALALEQGRIGPRTLVYDIERNYDGYVPTNFERRYAGPVSAQDALVASLNVPAVNLEFELGKNGLASFLRRSQLGPDRGIDAAGLSVALGAYPMTLEELVRLYSVLATGGVLAPISFTASPAIGSGRRLLLPEAAYLTADMLAQGYRPDLPQAWEFTPYRGKIAFKTGTSFGLRDAWCIGFNPAYTVGVWIGNVDAKGSSALIGSRAAAPLVAEVFNRLTRFGDSWFLRPTGVTDRQVCAVSGEALGKNCPAAVSDLSIAGVTNPTPCSLHRAILVRRTDGAEVCSACMNGRRGAYKTRVAEFWPPDVAQFLRDRGRVIPEPPPHNPDCLAVQSGRALRIQSPRPGGYYSLTEALPKDSQQIPLRVQSRKRERVNWFVNGQFFESRSSEETVYLPPIPGIHTVTVMNASGQYDFVRFRVNRRF